MVPLDHALALVASRQEGAEHLHLVALVLDVADVVEEHRVEVIESVEFALQRKVALGAQQPLHELGGRSEMHGSAAPH